MPLEDVSNDPSMVGWLRQAGHGHLLDEQRQYTNVPLSSPSPPIMSGGYSGTGTYGDSYNQSAAFSGVGNVNTQSYNQPASFSGAGYVNPQSYNQPASFSPVGNVNTQSYNQPVSFSGAGYVNPQSYNQPASFSPVGNVNTQSYDYPPSPTNFISSPTQFIAPHMNQPYDMDIENLKRDPNTRIIQRPPPDDVVYRQRVFVRYLQPPTPPVSGAIIVREKQAPPPPPDPPLVLKRAPPPPPTPPPVIIRERPPPMPPPEATTVINKIVPPPPKPPRQVIIEQYPPLPPKPQDVIIERWLPIPPRQRRILYERLPAPMINQPTTARPIIVQHGQPRVRIQREVFTAPGSQLPYQPVSSHTNLNQILSQIGTNQQIHSTVSPSSLISYSPYSTFQQTYSTTSHPQSNIIITQYDQPNLISSSSYGIPLSCVCTPNSVTGLGTYGSGISTIPTAGYSPGQSTVFNVPENVSVDSVLHQLGIDPYSLRQSTDPYSAVSNVWNAASHANPPHSLDPGLAVSHVWNAAAHAVDHYHQPQYGGVIRSSSSSGVLPHLFG